MPATRVILRAVGPSLANRGISNALPDPTLDLRDRNGERLTFNDDWMDGASGVCLVESYNTGD